MFCIRSGVSSASVITNIVSTAFPAARKYSIMFGIFPWCRKQDAVSVESAFKIITLRSFSALSKYAGVYT